MHVSQIPPLFSDSGPSAINHHLFLITNILLSYYIVIHVENYVIHLLHQFSFLVSHMGFGQYVFLCFQSTDKTNSPDTHKSFRNCSALY